MDRTRAHITGAPVLETERLLLRAPEIGDFDAFAAFYVSERSRYMGGPVPGKREAWRSFAHITGHWPLRGWGSFVMVRRADDRPVGCVGPWMPHGWPERELGWAVWETEAEGRGLAYEAMMRVRSHAFDDLGWDTAVSYIDRGNARSIALAGRLGAVLDDAAEKPDDEEPAALVYRHSRPATRASAA